MNRTRSFFAAILTVAALVTNPMTSLAQTAPPNIVNFQGRLAMPSGNPVADGTYNLRLRLYDAATGGTILYDQSLSNIPIKNGVFAVQLSGFTAANFNSNAWLGISINGSADLAPRTQIVSVPYAIKSNLALTVPDSSITNAKIAAGTLTADKLVTGTLNTTAWLLNGNSGVTSGFLGTTDNKPLEFRVNSRRATRYSYAENTNFQYRSINVLGGSELNTIAAGVVGATIAGGGFDRFNGSDYPNYVDSDFDTISGGYANAATGTSSAIGGGSSNTAIGGSSALGGGLSNVAEGLYSTIPGGYYNSARGVGSFAAGYRASALHDGTFVWADNQNAVFASSGINQFCIRASGGFVFEANTNPILYTSSTVGEKNRYLWLINSPDPNSGSASGLKAGGILCADNYDYASPGKNDMIVKGNVSIGYNFISSGYKLAVNGPVYALSGYFSSDARYKKNVAPMDNALARILQLRGVSYDWDKAKFPQHNFDGGKQIGFIAQEIEQIFPELVKTDANGYKAVNYVGVIPVLVEAVKTQNKKVETLSKENAELKARLERLEAAFADLKGNK